MRFDWGCNCIHDDVYSILEREANINTWLRLISVVNGWCPTTVFVAQLWDVAHNCHHHHERTAEEMKAEALRQFELAFEYHGIEKADKSAN